MTAVDDWKKQVQANGPWDLKVGLHGKSWLNKRSGKGELPYYSKISKNRQIYFNVWGNIFFGYVGEREGFPAWLLECGATKCIGGGGKVGKDTPGNNIERHMGYLLYDDYSPNDLQPASITVVILTKLKQLSHYCDALPFPEKSYPRRCNNPANW